MPSFQGCKIESKIVSNTGGRGGLITDDYEADISIECECWNGPYTMDWNYIM